MQIALYILISAAQSIFLLDCVDSTTGNQACTAVMSYECEPCLNCSEENQSILPVGVSVILTNNMDVMKDLKTMEKMLDLESDKLMMEEINNLKVEVTLLARKQEWRSEKGRALLTKNSLSFKSYGGYFGIFFSRKGICYKRLCGTFGTLSNRDAHFQQDGAGRILIIAILGAKLVTLLHLVLSLRYKTKSEVISKANKTKTRRDPLQEWSEVTYRITMILF
ncbi:uncharacterized protein LOC114536157 isoform X2 [Dendronephthya gigantea]|uniref:uncharacterized protein LOC114536157 isoform X2 n=1 Tax=Dendronephthya gigantea TaxID=151771 RepID=UPI00106C7BF5|nr:uncharacterized protein LOC114536157 isoform X2 [Dendronephthya gigantea]